MSAGCRTVCCQLGQHKWNNKLRIFGRGGCYNTPDGPRRASLVPWGAALSCRMFGFANFKVRNNWVAPGRHSKTGKSGHCGLWGHRCCRWAHGTGGGTTWAATNIKPNKFGRFGGSKKNVDCSRFSFPIKMWAKIMAKRTCLTTWRPQRLGGGTTACWVAF